MKRRTSTRARARVDRLMPVHARMHEERLADDFTHKTMAAVRCANARMQQHQPIHATRRIGAASAAVALAGLIITAALVVALTFERTPVSPGPTGEPQVANNDAAAPSEHINWPTLDLRARPTFTLDKTFVAPIRDEAEALIDTGRDMGVAMLSALPARPQSWSDRLNEHTSR